VRRILLNIVLFLLLAVCVVRISFYVPRSGVDRVTVAKYEQERSSELLEVTK